MFPHYLHENRLRWFGHVQRKTVGCPVRRIESIIVEGKRSRGRPKKTWVEQIKSDLSELYFSVDLTRDRISWRRQIHIFELLIVSLVVLLLLHSL